MSQKPSERIKEIREEGGKEINLDGPGMYYTLSKSEAIVQYLDEEWEKRQTAFQYREQKADHCCRCVTACGHSTPPSFCEKHS